MLRSFFCKGFLQTSTAVEDSQNAYELFFVRDTECDGYAVAETHGSQARSHIIALGSSVRKGVEAFTEAGDGGGVVVGDLQRGFF